MPGAEALRGNECDGVGSKVVTQEFGVARTFAVRAQDRVSNALPVRDLSLAAAAEHAAIPRYGNFYEDTDQTSGGYNVTQRAAIGARGIANRTSPPRDDSLRTHQGPTDISIVTAKSEAPSYVFTPALGCGS